VSPTSAGIRSLAHALSLKLQRERELGTSTTAGNGPPGPSQHPHLHHQLQPHASLLHHGRASSIAVGAASPDPSRATPEAAGGQPGSTLRSAEASESAALLLQLDWAVEALNPPLDDMMAAAAARVGRRPAVFVADPDVLPRLQRLHDRLQATRGVLSSGAAPSPENVTSAWLTFRLLYAGLTAVLTRSIPPPVAISKSPTAGAAPRVLGGSRSSSMCGMRTGGASASRSSSLASGLPGGDGIAAAAAATALNLRSGGRTASMQLSVSTSRFSSPRSSPCASPTRRNHAHSQPGSMHSQPGSIVRHVSMTLPGHNELDDDCEYDGPASPSGSRCLH